MTALSGNDPVVGGKDLPWSAPPGRRLAVVPGRRVRVGFLLALVLVAVTSVPATRAGAATGPLVTITSGPQDPTPTNDPTPTFGFTSADPLATTQCRIDADSFAACSSPYTTGPLADGPHTFEVVATDALGTQGPTASRAFTVDTVPPDGRITGGPTGVIKSSMPTFTFDSEPGATFLCKVDSNSYVACSSPWTRGPLTDGPHTFTVEARDAAGNQDPSPASASFVVDTKPPETVITSGPPAKSTDNTPTFAFGADDPGASFECSLDGSAFSSCTSPRTVGPLPTGDHSFAVRARDAVGNVDATPATIAFTILAPAVDRPSPAGPDPVVVLAKAFAGDLGKAVATLRTSELPAIARRRGIIVRGLDPLLPGTARMKASARRVAVLRGAKTFWTAGRGALRLKSTTSGRKLLSGARRLRLVVAYVFTARIGIRMSAAAHVTVWRHWLTLTEVARVARRWIHRYFGDRPRSLTLDRCARRGHALIRCADVRWLHRGKWWHVRLRVHETETGFRQRMTDAYST